MKQLTVISGKGGTGKTSITAAFGVLARNKVIADCDVDAADLHLIFRPKIEKRMDFSGSRLAVMDEDKCIKCFKCAAVCPMQINMPYDVKSAECIRCGKCVDACPTDALAFKFQWQ